MSTTYHVELTARAARDLRALFLSIQASESRAAARWLNGLERAIATLRRSPHRCPIAPETSAQRVVRHLLYGRKPNVYRILYHVVQSRSAVFVLHIRHGVRLPVSARG